MNVFARTTGLATATARVGLALGLSACSGQSASLPVATTPQAQTASFDALPNVVSAASHPVSVKTVHWLAIPKAVAGVAFAHPAKIEVVALDASGKRIAGTYANPVELHDGDASGATQLLIGGKPASPKNRLTKSTDVVSLSYDGLAIVPATLSAAARGVASKATFAPKLNEIVYSGPTSGTVPSIALTSPNATASFSATEAGWTNAPYNRALRVVADPACASFANVSSKSATSFVVSAISSPATGTCDLHVEDFAGGNTLVVAASYAGTLSAVPLFVATGNAGNGVYQVPAGCATASCVIPVGGGFSQPYGTAFDSSGNLWVADQAGFTTTPIFEMAPTCATAYCVTSLGSIAGPAAIAFDAAGNAFVVGGISSTANGNLYEIPAGCTTTVCIKTLVTGLALPTGVAVDPSGDIFIADQDVGAFELPHGSTCSTATCLVSIADGGALDGYASAVAVARGVVYVAYTSPSALVRKESISCVSATSDCFTAVGGSLQDPWGLAVDANGDVYISDVAASALYAVPPGCAASSCMVNITPSGAFTEVYGIAVQAAPPDARHRKR